MVSVYPDQVFVASRSRFPAAFPRANPTEWVPVSPLLLVVLLQKQRKSARSFSCGNGPRSTEPEAKPALARGRLTIAGGRRVRHSAFTFPFDRWERAACGRS